MAERRMMSIKIIDTDKFIQMPITTRLLYYDYCMRADDDGFIGSPQKIMKMIGCSDDDYKLLIVKGYIIPFEDGICVIKHWRIHNYIRKDRYHETAFIAQKNELVLEEDTYELKTGIPLDIPMVDPGKVRLELGNKKENIKRKKSEVRKDSLPKKEYGNYKHVLLTDKEYDSLKKEYKNYQAIIDYLDLYIEEKGYKSKSHYLAIKRWVVDAVTKKNFYTNNNKPSMQDTFNEAMEMLKNDRARS